MRAAGLRVVGRRVVGLRVVGLRVVGLGIVLAAVLGGGLAPAALAGPAAVANPAVPPTPTPGPDPGSTTRSMPVEPRDGEAAKARMDARRDRVPAEVAAWYVDPTTHQTVVLVVGPTTRAAADFAADANPAAVRVQASSAPVRPLVAAPAPTPAPAPAPTPLVGGTAISSAGPTRGGLRCSDGWSVRRGTTLYLLTAGHCTDEGTDWSGPDGRALGRVSSTRWPTADYGLIQVADPSAWRGSGQVAGGPVVTGSAPAPIGTRVCRSGSTSGYRCGVIRAQDVTVNYGGGLVVAGLTQTDACAEAGDSGGSVLAPGTRQAQGTLSGGSGDCTTGGTSYFQPLGPVLDRLTLTLVTGS